jgi:hypothetical protein
MPAKMQRFWIRSTLFWQIQGCLENKFIEEGGVKYRFKKYREPLNCMIYKQQKFQQS